MGQGVLAHSGKPYFAPFGEFMNSAIHCIICQSWSYVYGLLTDLFTWINLAEMSQTCFIIYDKCHCIFIGSYMTILTRYKIIPDCITGFSPKS